MKIQIDYDGRSPILCSGRLKVTIDDVVWEFSDDCLISGGTCYINEELIEDVEYGEWDVKTWPKNFPEELKHVVIDAINDEIPFGCCGGCI